ncbi:proline dehydrogenase family protein [Kurthia gibsonii]|uniref:proline dehydrogenase family protein n=1 Tax=Kurthia gibsonii TaxID=33946 RepID=UPI001141C0AD|nr:proline dehydrogenase family protein [Kurthia gibsonii]GED19674.1 proline dehydrogenase [Kurthia gibsonii]
MALKDFFIALSENQFLNDNAKKYGLKLGAQTVVAGINLDEVIISIQKLNAQGISCTVDHLGEFVQNEAEAITVKEEILHLIEVIHEHQLDAHISLKPSQLGLNLNVDFCYQNIEEIVSCAQQSKIFVNFDMENYERLQTTLDFVLQLSKTYDNVGTVIQAYLHCAMDDLETLKNTRVRIVKGAYKEPETVAFQTKGEIDANFIRLAEYHLLNGKFTSIATHDHRIIAHLQTFIREQAIAKEKYEFQMLYGFRTDLQESLANEGYPFCTYIPYGEDWYGYFMRRLAERPQNINLVVKQVFNKKTNTLIGIGAVAFLLGRLTKKIIDTKKRGRILHPILSLLFVPSFFFKTRNGFNAITHI